MFIRTSFLIVLIFSYFAQNAYAEQKIDVGEFISTMSGTNKISESAWRMRVLNYQTIGHLEATNQFAPWCRYEARKSDTNHIPCQILAQEGPDAESKVIEAIRVTKLLIKALESEPSTEENNEHISIFKEQLSQMERLPTPLHSIVDTIKKTQ